MWAKVKLVCRLHQTTVGYVNFFVRQRLANAGSGCMTRQGRSPNFGLRGLSLLTGFGLTTFLTDVTTLICVLLVVFISCSSEDILLVEFDDLVRLLCCSSVKCVCVCTCAFS